MPQTEQQRGCTTAVTIGASTQFGDDPVPIFTAGENKMHCVMSVESLATIDIQQAVFNGSTNVTSSATYKDLRIDNPIVKESWQDSSGTPYSTAGRTYTGKGVKTGQSNAGTQNSNTATA